MNILTQAIKVFLKSLVGIFTPASPFDFGTRMEQVLAASYDMLLGMIPALLQELDNTLAKDPKRKAEWEIVRKDKRELVTSFGNLQFERRYYRHKKTGEMAYLLDEHLGILAHAKVNGDVRQKAIQGAEQGSYAKSAEASTVSTLSSMSVCNYVKELDNFPALQAEGEKRAVQNIYVEADEDHVALQDGRNTQARLVYIHEGVQQDGERKRLIHPRYLTCSQGKDPDSFWENVSTFIDQQYDSGTTKHIFLSGDCAAWIRTGEEWLYPCVPILDGFHTMKALRTLCGGRQGLLQEFLHSIRGNDREQAVNLCRKILADLPDSERTGKQKIAKYLLGNWPRIQNQRHPDAIGCSAEGHVSHILSERLSSRPCGWSSENMERIAQLRIMRANGQLIRYEELKKTKISQKIDQPVSRATALIKSPGLRKSLAKNLKSSVNEACRNLPILNHGATSPLYQALHGLSHANVAC